MPTPLASAFIRIRPETSSFQRDTERDLERTGQSAGQKAGRQFGSQFSRQAQGEMRNGRSGFIRAGEDTGRETGRRFGRSMSSGINIKGIISGIAAGFSLIAGAKVFGEFISEARESIRTGKLTEAVIKSTGGAANISADQVGNLATALSNKVGVDDEAIQSAANLLLTFKDVRNEAGSGNKIFNQATAAIVDMTAAMNNGTVDSNGLKSSTIQLGKALNDPIKGITALTRVGVTFTQKQKDQIKSLVEHGKRLQAQKIILKEVQSEFGGAAKASADPAQRLSVAWANVEETIGLKLMPLLTKLANWIVGPGLTAVGGFVNRVQDITTAVSGVVGGPLGTFFGFLKAGGTWGGILRGALAGVVTALIAIKIATAAWAAIQAVLNAELFANPIGLVVIAIGALVGGLILAYRHSATFRAIVQGAFSAVMTTARAMGNVVVVVLNFIRDHWRLIISIIGGPFGIAVALVTKYWGTISRVTSSVVTGVINFVRNHWRLIISILGGPLGLAIALITRHWHTIQSGTTRFVTGILNYIRTRWRTVVSIFSIPLQLVIALFTGRWGKIRQLTDQLANALLSKIRSMMSGAGRAFRSGVDAIQSAWNRVKNATKTPINFVIGTVYNRGIVGLWNKVMGWLHLPGSLRLGTLPLLAQGGAVPARPGVFNRPTAIVGEGDPNHPEYVIPTDPKHRARALALWSAAGQQMQMMDIGGILGGIKRAAGKVVDIGKTAFDLITNPGKVWDTLVSKFVPSAAGLATSPFGQAAAAIPKDILGRARTFAVQFLKAFADGFGGDSTGVVKAALRHVGEGDDRGPNNNQWTRKWGMVGAPWCAIFVSEMIKEARATKKYPGSPSAAVASYVGAMRHVSTGRAGDLAAYRGTGHINVIEKPAGGGAYWTIGGNQNAKVQHGIRSGMSSILRPLARGGMLVSPKEFRQIFRTEALKTADRHEPSPLTRALGKMSLASGMAALSQIGRIGTGKGLFDSGGLGMGWPFSSRSPEPVLTGTQWADIHTLAKRGSKPSVTVNLHGVPGIPSEKQITNAIDNLFTLHGRW